MNFTLVFKDYFTRINRFIALTKPKVVSLIVFTAIIGMLLSTTKIIPIDILLYASVGIWLVAGSAAAFNCLVEQKLDIIMARTKSRPLPMGYVNSVETIIFSSFIGIMGLLILYFLVNPLTMILTFSTFIGYAIIYTIVLKPLTPQNIVIGGASGAMPPVLGWTSITGEISGQALLLFLIIFAWTPPHFWALALYREKEYSKANIPMLPVTHGKKYTQLSIFFYTIILFIVSILPFVTRNSGYIYFIAALILGVIFLNYAYLILKKYTDEIAKKTFKYSIIYLSLIFLFLLIDHYAGF